MRRVGHSQAGARHGQQTEITWSMVPEDKRVGIAQEINESGQDMIAGRLSPDYAVSDAVHLLGICGNGYVRSAQLLSRGITLMARRTWKKPSHTPLHLGVDPMTAHVRYKRRATHVSWRRAACQHSRSATFSVS